MLQITYLSILYFNGCYQEKEDGKGNKDYKVIVKNRFYYYDLKLLTWLTTTIFMGVIFFYDFVCIEICYKIEGMNRENITQRLCMVTQ